VAALHAASWGSAYRGILSDDYLDRQVGDHLLSMWTGRFAAEDSSRLVLLAEEGPELLGFACVFLDADRQWGTLLDNLHVGPRLKGRGLGKTLLTAAAEWCEQRRPGAPLHFWVYEGNHAARAFYEHLGARQIERVTKSLEDGGKTESLRYVWSDVRALLGQGLKA
jgi:GNAT superfamily N-acetyltransferase